MSNITGVWIEEGCICCQACVGAVPEVFCFPADNAEVVGAVRVDGTRSRNEAERSPLNAIGLELEAQIEEAAEGCPVEIIKLERAA